MITRAYSYQKDANDEVASTKQYLTKDALSLFCISSQYNLIKRIYTRCQWKTLIALLIGAGFGLLIFFTLHARYAHYLAYAIWAITGGLVIFLWIFVFSFRLRHISRVKAKFSQINDEIDPLFGYDVRNLNAEEKLPKRLGKVLLAVNSAWEKMSSKLFATVANGKLKNKNVLKSVYKVLHAYNKLIKTTKPNADVDLGKQSVFFNQNDEISFDEMIYRVNQYFNGYSFTAKVRHLSKRDRSVELICQASQLDGNCSAINCTSSFTKFANRQAKLLTKLTFFGGLIYLLSTLFVFGTAWLMKTNYTISITNVNVLILVMIVILPLMLVRAVGFVLTRGRIKHSPVNFSKMFIANIFSSIVLGGLLGLFNRNIPNFMLERAAAMFLVNGLGLLVVSLFSLIWKRRLSNRVWKRLIFIDLVAVIGFSTLISLLMYFFWKTPNAHSYMNFVYPFGGGAILFLTNVLLFIGVGRIVAINGVSYKQKTILRNPFTGLCGLFLNQLLWFTTDNVENLIAVPALAYHASDDSACEAIKVKRY